MKNRFTILSLWLLSITGTFALGWAVKPPSGPEASSEKKSDRTGFRPASRAAIGKAGKLTPTETDTLTVSEGGHRIPLDKYISGGSIDAENMSKAITDMRRENDPLKRRAMFSQLLEQLTPENAKAAFLAMRGGGGDRRGRRDWGRGDEERLLLDAWGRIDGAGAIAELKVMEEERRKEREARGETGPGGRDRGRGDRGGFDIASILSGWATTDSNAAMEYVNGVEDAREKGMLTGSLIRGLMVNGVDDAVSFISSLPADDENRGRHMWMVAEDVLEDGVANAAQWVSNLSDDSLKEGAMRRIAESYSRENLDGAIEWVRQHGSQAYARGAVTEVAERWAESDPKAVIEWAADLPEETQRSVFVEALDEWTERDAVAASAYLDEMPASPVKDSAIQGFATELVRDDPQAAATWAATIDSEELRAETLIRVGQEWYGSDRSAAEAWLQTSGLSAEQLQQVTERRRWDRRRGGR